MTKYGSWYVKFELTLEGEDVRWDDLSDATQEHIAEMIKDGYVSGEIVEECDEEEQNDVRDEFADIVWSVEDIQALRPDWTEERCRRWIAENEKAFRDVLTHYGNECLECMLE